LEKLRGAASPAKSDSVEPIVSDALAPLRLGLADLLLPVSLHTVPDMHGLRAALR